MALIDEYAQHKQQQSGNRIIKNQLKAGLNANLIASTSKIPLS